jgi:hypothetical protein
MNLMELQAIADSEGISYPDDVKHHVLYRIILDQMPMVDGDPLAPPGAQPGPGIPSPIVDEKPDDSPASARIKRIRQAN